MIKYDKVASLRTCFDQRIMRFWDSSHILDSMEGFLSTYRLAGKLRPTRGVTSTTTCRKMQEALKWRSLLPGIFWLDMRDQNQSFLDVIVLLYVTVIVHGLQLCTSSNERLLKSHKTRHVRYFATSKAGTNGVQEPQCCHVVKVMHLRAYWISKGILSVQNFVPLALKNH